MLINLVLLVLVVDQVVDRFFDVRKILLLLLDHPLLLIDQSKQLSVLLLDFSLLLSIILMLFLLLLLISLNECGHLDLEAGDFPLVGHDHGLVLSLFDEVLDFVLHHKHFLTLFDDDVLLVGELLGHFIVGIGNLGDVFLVSFDGLLVIDNLIEVLRNVGFVAVDVGEKAWLLGLGGLVGVEERIFLAFCMLLPLGLAIGIFGLFLVDALKDWPVTQLGPVGSVEAFDKVTVESCEALAGKLIQESAHSILDTVVFMVVHLKFVR